MAQLELTPKANWGRKILLVALGLALLGNYLRGTQLPVDVSGLSPLILFRISQLGVGLAIIKILFIDANSWRFKAGFLAMSLFLYYVGSNAHLLDIFFYFVILVAAKDEDYRWLLRCYLIEVAVIMLSLALLTFGGILNDMTMVRPGGTLRMSFGSVTPSDFAAHVFHWLVAYFCYRNFKLSWIEYLVSLVATWGVFRFTGTRLDLILMAVTLVLAVSYPKLKKLINYLDGWSLGAIMLVYLGFNLAINYLFTPEWTWFRRVDELLSHRLTYGQLALQKPLTLFGRYFRENGNGKFNPHQPYFFIDSSFVRLLAMQGILLFTCFVIMLIFLAWRFKAERTYSLLLGLGLVLLSAAIDHHLWELSYNFIFLASLTDNQHFIVKRK